LSVPQNWFGPQSAGPEHVCGAFGSGWQSLLSPQISPGAQSAAVSHGREPQPAHAAAHVPRTTHATTKPNLECIWTSYFAGGVRGTFYGQWLGRSYLRASGSLGTHSWVAPV
jgi:hypothetical protein